jgi:hypothetical protein
MTGENSGIFVTGKYPDEFSVFFDCKSKAAPARHGYDQRYKITKRVSTRLSRVSKAFDFSGLQHAICSSVMVISSGLQIKGGQNCHRRAGR